MATLRGMRSRPLRLALGTLVASMAATALALPAAATVSPSNCGRTEVRGKTYEIKTHVISCRRGKPMAVDYLRTGRRPRGYSCRDYSARVTKFRFICRRGGSDFLAIRR